MLHRSRAAHNVLAFLAALQLVLPGAVSWADARLDAGPPGTAHVEDHSSTACPRMHPADCALHRFLSAPTAVGRVEVTDLQGWAARAVASIDRTRPRPSARGRLPDSRAPPALS